MTLRDALNIHELLVDDPLASRLIPIALEPTGVTSSGFPFLQRAAWERFRDGVPHLLGMGLHTFRAVANLERAVADVDASEAERDNVLAACKVFKQVVRTATITAPPDLWLLRHVLGYFAELGLNELLLSGAAIYPESCRLFIDGSDHQLDEAELEKDLHFLLARGIVEQYDNGFRIAGHPRVRRLLERLVGVPEFVPVSATAMWRKVFGGAELSPSEIRAIRYLGAGPPSRLELVQNHWVPTWEEVVLGYRLVPVVLGLRASELTRDRALGDVIRPSELSRVHPDLASYALQILGAAGWLEPAESGWSVTETGARGLQRGPGPFGIIETYHPYMARGADILLGAEGSVWVRRGENVGASQDANAGTFRHANDALDRFCRETQFSYGVFVEHAIGRGEATRQRFERSGEASIRYFGADLEDDAIDAAVEEQRAGRLPSNMVFVRGADIGKPEVLLDAMKAAGVESHGAVMLVGNGFHEVRQQSDEGMVEVFRGYHDAGVLLLFTEENALSVDDLRATAWNTYHAGFKYVHEKSGQGLRPAEPRPPVRLGHRLRAAWSECARRAGYVRADEFCARTRTIYPYTPRSGHNPSISVNHFFVPTSIAAELGLSDPLSA